LRAWFGNFSWMARSSPLVAHNGVTLNPSVGKPGARRQFWV
jgi:hypothetical protein